MVKKQLVISRRVYQQEDFDKLYPDEIKQQMTVPDRIRAQCYCSKTRLWKFFTTILPIIGVVRKYRLREYIVGDILAGLTVAIMHIPQGMGFGILASLKPIYGLYTSFWPVLFYMIFGTSTHVSFGTNAVICLLVAAITSRQMETFQFDLAGFNSTLSNDTADIDSLMEAAGLEYRVSITAATAFLAGVILFGMGILRLGFVTLYLSDSFISGFTTGAAVHITTSQVPKMLAFGVGSIQGAGKIVRTYIAIFRDITKTNVADLLIAVISIIVLVLVKECINERFKSKMKMPVPIDLIVVIIGTIISHFGRLSEVFGVTIVGQIPPGIPTPAVPPLDEVGNFAVDSFVIAILIFAMTIAMAKLMAKKHSYEIDDNQELIAYGLTNVISSFLLCFPSCVAPPRTMLQSSMGARTTLCGVFTAALLFLVIMAIGPLFQSLPVSLLAAMIVVAMKGLFMQVFDLKLYWKVNIFDLVSWLGTFLAVVLIDIDIGLVVGVGLSAFTVLIQSQFAKGYLLGKAAEEDVYASAEKKGINSVPGVRVFRFEASLYYATAEIFRSRLYKATINPKKFMKARAKAEKLSLTSCESSSSEGNAKNENSNNGKANAAQLASDGIHHVVIDCQPFSYIDIAGIKMLRQVITEMKTADVTVFLYGCSLRMMRALEGGSFFDAVPKDHVFLDVYDAVQAVRLNESDEESGDDGDESQNFKV
ncbi:prestin-like [Liolophura sinensis]|uniref:prestin-like n=1 Tax=Liolophura sinensis TaxID=3198878 RepID=UPI003158E439